MELEDHPKTAKIESPSCKKRHVCVPKSFVLSYRFRGGFYYFASTFFSKTTPLGTRRVFFLNDWWTNLVKMWSSQPCWTPPDCPI